MTAEKLLLAVFALTAHCACAAALDTVPLLKYAGTLKKMDVLTGGATYSFLFDTGGGETLLTPDLAAKVCKKIYGRGLGYRMHGELVPYQKCDGVDIRIGKTDIFHPTVGVFDIMSLFPQGVPQVSGLVSLNSFKDKIISMDLPAGLLTIETARSAKKKKKRMTLLESRFRDGISGDDLGILLGVRRGGALYWFLFDTGNGHHALISPQTAYEWGLQKDPAAIGALHNAELSFGTLTGTFDMQADNVIYDGVLNFGIISRKSYLIDFPARQIWMD